MAFRPPGKPGHGSLDSIGNGTSKTTRLGETARLDVRCDNVGVPGGISDGTSSTTLLGKKTGLAVIPRGVGPPR